MMKRDRAAMDILDKAKDADDIPQSVFDVLAEANPALADLGRRLARSERIEHDVRALQARYQRKKSDRYGSNSFFIDYDDAIYDLQEILDGKP